MQIGSEAQALISAVEVQAPPRAGSRLATTWMFHSTILQISSK
jgi:hypothetical protein